MFILKKKVKKNFIYVDGILNEFKYKNKFILILNVGVI